MRCPRCNFENIPGQSRCFKCDSILESKATGVNVHPPRMAKWKKPLRSIFRWTRRQSVIPEEVTRPRVPNWMRIMSADAFFGLVLSIVPGLAHFLQGRFREVRLYCAAWLVLLLTGLFLYGRWIGLFLLGLAIGLHAWIAFRHTLVKELLGFFNKLIVMLVMLAALLLFYRTVARMVFSDFTGGYTNSAIAYHNIKVGDYLLARRSRATTELMTRGSLVLARLASVGGGNRLFRRGGTMIVEIVGLPGEQVGIENDVFMVDGQPLDAEKYPVPRWLRGTKILIEIADDSYFLSGEYNVYAHGRSLNNADICNACVVKTDDIKARAFMRWLPLSRRGFIRPVK